MKLVILKETEADENRVAASPETVKKYIGIGFEVTLVKGAGDAANMPDQAFKDAGASISASNKTAVKSADVILCVRFPDADTLEAMKKDAIVIGALNPFNNEKRLKELNNANLTGVAMEFMPRITRAQNMDILSSQSNLAGYRSVIEAANAYASAFPMMMTAAGTVPPAKVFVMGAGVAGLQAIATAKRLGAVVSATDVRPAAKEQVESLGGKFVMVESDEAKEAETAGGYAKEMSDDFKKKQAELIAETIKKQDIVITTALIPGRPAPVLVTEDMLKTMKPGAVLVDLAVEQGGNCPASEAGKVVEKHGVTLIGYSNMAGRVAGNASALYAKNLLNFVTHLHDKENGGLNVNLEDEITGAVVLTHAGKTVHEKFAKTTSKNSEAA